MKKIIITVLFSTFLFQVFSQTKEETIDWIASKIKNYWVTKESHYLDNKVLDDNASYKNGVSFFNCSVSYKGNGSFSVVKDFYDLDEIWGYHYRVEFLFNLNDVISYSKSQICSTYGNK